MTVWTSDRLWSNFLLAGLQVVLFGGEDWNPNAAKWLEKYQINLDADILPVRGTGKSSTLVWHHNIWDLMLGASLGLEILERGTNRE